MINSPISFELSRCDTLKIQFSTEWSLRAISSFLRTKLNTVNKIYACLCNQLLKLDVLTARIMLWVISCAYHRHTCYFWQSILPFDLQITNFIFFYSRKNKFCSHDTSLTSVFILYACNIHTVTVDFWVDR